MTVRARLGLLALALAAACIAPAGAHGADPGRCRLPGAGEFERVAPGAVDLDRAKVHRAIDFATTRNSLSVRVYRRGCLVGTSALDPLTEGVPNNVWSTTKGVVSLLTGRAQALGHLRLKDPISKYVPEADAEHGRITVRDLLTQTSGLKFAWTADLNLAMPDGVRFTLGLPFEHRRGTYFEYAQTTVSLLAHVVERAVGEDLQSFAQRELFAPLNIPGKDWFWLRDRSGHTHGYAYLYMPPAHLARLGHLMLDDGRWRGRRLLRGRYARRAHAPNRGTNEGYGFLLWTNAGRYVVSPSIPDRVTFPGPKPMWPSAPRDTYAFVGFQDQIIFAIPSLEMVIVRTGIPGNRSLDPQTLVTANTGDWMHEFFRILMSGVRDREVPDPGPYVDHEPVPLDLQYFVDPVLVPGALGIGEGAPPGCNPVGCNGEVAIEGYLQALEDIVGTVGGG